MLLIFLEWKRDLYQGAGPFRRQGSTLPNFCGIVSVSSSARVVGSKPWKGVRVVRKELEEIGLEKEAWRLSFTEEA